MKIAVQGKFTPTDTPSLPENTPSPHVDGVCDPFLAFIARAAGVTRKQIKIDLVVSNTLVDDWFAGKKADPITRARKLVSMFPPWARAAILLHVAGDDLDGQGIISDQAKAVACFAELVMGKQKEKK